MKSYKNIEEINKEWGKYGVRINEKGELVANHEGKEYKIGQANFFTENEKSVNPKEVKGKIETKPTKNSKKKKK